MAHIPDGVLSAPVLIISAVVSTALLTLAVRRLEDEQIPRTAVLAATFFVASLIAIPLGPSSVHLLLNGLMGLLLGWAAIPALFVALLLQLVMFGHGGLTSLGVNLAVLALPALFAALVLRPLLINAPAQRIWWIGALAGGTGVLGSGALIALVLALSGDAFVPAAQLIAIAYLPLALLESAICVSTIAFLYRVEPRLLALPDAS